MDKPTPGQWRVEPEVVSKAGFMVKAKDASEYADEGDERIVASYLTGADARLIAKAPELRDVAEATILFYKFPWDESARQRWQELTGSAEASSKSLCEFARKVLTEVESPSS